MDIMTPMQRRRAMTSNRGRTRPERMLASALWMRGFRYLTANGYKGKYGRILGNPDLIFTRKRIVIFVDGCFWHGCRVCKKSDGLTDPSWIEKIDRNRERDQRVTAELECEGWTVLRIPEHDVRTKAALIGAVDRLIPLLRGL